MAESDAQRIPLTYAVERLGQHFRGRDDVYVTGNLLLYYEEGNPGASVAPDVFVVMGAKPGVRSSYRLWEEPKAPDFVLEVTSRTTHREDQGKKRELYRRLAVTEYWQYDPTSDYLQPALQGLELSGGEYRRLAGRQLADGTLALPSEVLGLEVRLTQRGLRFHDPQTGRDLPTLAETDAVVEREQRLREEAETRLEQEAAARQRAEARVAELEERLRPPHSGESR